jgi:hypothetical protein
MAYGQQRDPRTKVQGCAAVLLSHKHFWHCGSRRDTL